MEDNRISMWVEQARGGNADALGQVMEYFRPYLLSVAHAQLMTDVRGKAAVSDVVQETFLRAHRGFDRFQGASSEELRGWLRTILLNHIVTIQRHYASGKRNIDREVSLTCNCPSAQSASLHTRGRSPSSICVRTEEADAVTQALYRLPDHYRLVLQLRNWHDKSWSEIGAELGRTPEASRKLWARALRRLRDELRSTPQ